MQPDRAVPSNCFNWRRDVVMFLGCAVAKHQLKAVSAFPCVRVCGVVCVCVWACMHACKSVSVCVRVSTRPCACEYVHMCLSFSLSLSLSLSLPLSLSIYIYTHTMHTRDCLVVYNIRVCVCACVCLSVCEDVCFSSRVEPCARHFFRLLGRCTCACYRPLS